MKPNSLVSSSVSYTYFGNALMQHCNFMKSLYENKTAEKKLLKRILSLHVYYASLNKKATF